MSLSAAVGYTQSLDGREAAIQATRQALDQIGHNPAILGIVIASSQYSIQSVLSGVLTLLGDTPLFGFSTSDVITNQGALPHTVGVALLAGEDVSARAEWFSGFSDNSRHAAQQILQNLQLQNSEGILLLTADGFNGDARHLCDILPRGDYTVAGCLAGGSVDQAKTYQIGGRQSGSGGLAAALLSGSLVTGIGYGHGWQPIGAYFRITHTSGSWLHKLDYQSVADTYAELFHIPARDWVFPPLNEMVRLYPLGIEQSPGDPLLVRAPIRMEADGSLRMNTVIPFGGTGHLLVGSIEACLQAARQSARQALDFLGSSRPVFAMLFVDVAWQMLFQSQPGREVQAVREILGDDVPIIGGYTYGQIVRHPASSDDISRSAELLHQHIEVVLIGEKEK